jgi:hypothetical protein
MPKVVILMNDAISLDGARDRRWLIVGVIGLIVMANLSTIALMPRFGPKPLVASGMLAASGGAAWLAQLGAHTGYAAGVLGPLVLAGTGLGMVIAPAINAGTFGVAPQDAGAASATVTVGQMLGGSVGTSLLNTIFAAGAVVGGVLLRRGPLGQPRTPSSAPGGVTAVQAEAGREQAR